MSQFVLLAKKKYIYIFIKAPFVKEQNEKKDRHGPCMNGVYSSTRKQSIELIITWITT